MAIETENDMGAINIDSAFAADSDFVAALMRLANPSADREPSSSHPLSYNINNIVHGYNENDYGGIGEAGQGGLRCGDSAFFV